MIGYIFRVGHSFLYEDYFLFPDVFLHDEITAGEDKIVVVCPTFIVDREVVLLKVALGGLPERAAQNREIEQTTARERFNEPVTVIGSEITIAISQVARYLVHLSCLIKRAANEKDFFH